MIETARLEATACEGAGYASAQYAHALAEFGRPRPLTRAGGWLIERPIPGGSGLRDAMGPYPLFSCARWEDMHQDLASLEGELVSLVLVSDPLGGYDCALLSDLFPDLMRPYKSHYVVELDRPPFARLPTHHRRNLRRALGGVSVEVCTDPWQFLDQWTALYDVLIARHDIRGMTAFSPQSFAGQFQVPGLVALRATEGDATVAMHLWVRRGRYAYYHLGAASERGYALRAAYALMHRAIEHFGSAGCEWLDLGAGAGAAAGDGDGLSRFKQGWGTGTMPAYLCGRILDRAAYDWLYRRRAASGSDYFPAYRRGEFR